MKNARSLVVGVTFLALLGTLGVLRTSLERVTIAHAARGNVVMVPRYEVDPTFPKPLPNHWVPGSVVGVSVDAQDHIWMIHRPDSLGALENAEGMNTGTCCAKAPAIMEFDQAGNLLRHWGGPGPG